MRSLIKFLRGTFLYIIIPMIIINASVHYLNTGVLSFSPDIILDFKNIHYNMEDLFTHLFN